MTLQLDLRPEVEAELARQAAAQGLDVPAYAVRLLERAAQPPATEPSAVLEKNLVDLFQESPLKGLDLDFMRNRSTGRPLDA